MKSFYVAILMAWVSAAQCAEQLKIKIGQINPDFLKTVDPDVGLLVRYLGEYAMAVNKAIELKIKHRVRFPDGRESYSNITSQFPLTGFNDLFTIEGSPFAIPSSDGGKHLERYCKVSFDGAKWIDKTFRIGNPGDIFEEKEAVISESPPEVLNDHIITSGAAILPTAFRTFKHSVSLNGLLSGVTKTLFSVEVAQDPKYGKVVVITSSGSTERIELSVANKFAMIRHTASGEQWSKKIEVNQLQEIAPNFWVPKSFTFETLEPDGNKYIRTSIIESARLIDVSELKNGMVQKLEPGYRVYDRRTNVRFTVGEPPKSVIQRQLKLLQEK